MIYKDKTPALELKGIVKSFGSVQALKNVNIEAYHGKIMALMGENGAGKSTLMKIIAGVHKKDKGEIKLNGNKIKLNSPKESQNLGIAIIYQELNLLKNMSVMENIYLGREFTKKFGMIDWDKMKSETQKYIDRLNIHIKPTDKVGNLSIAKQQMVEIAKALSLKANIIIMDEPTDTLTENEIKKLFEIMKSLKKHNKAVIFISHKLQEIFEVCDYVTIIRDGEVIDTKLMENITEAEMIQKMVGRTLDEQYPRVPSRIGDTILELKNVSNQYIQNISFKLKKGEVLGIAGLIGSGRTEVAKTIFGALPYDKGTILMNGSELNIHSPKDAINKGIMYVSEDRKNEGLFLEHTLRDNMSISAIHKFANHRISIDKAKELEEVQKYKSRFDIKANSVDTLIKNLSGGTQQKVSIAKALMTNPKILILDEPTKGIDIGAKREIYDLINEFKLNGMSIIIISSDLPEVLGMSDRILIMNNTTIGNILDIKEATQESVMQYAISSKKDEIKS